ncbi:hypothetical protein BZG36_01046 [Bifiguratus adelaidae]|uniref:Uncharacterized protein n=1 Tax=Bifiguratus adelaidae TaxID=1938954 RepID=A0A261Y6E9_9FUNG|nr:hypothetical protein BZG36_01046 [Bifiguratus adelaidae]
MSKTSLDPIQEAVQLPTFEEQNDEFLTPNVLDRTPASWLNNQYFPSASSTESVPHLSDFDSEGTSKGPRQIHQLLSRKISTSLPLLTSPPLKLRRTTEDSTTDFGKDPLIHTGNDISDDVAINDVDWVRDKAVLYGQESESEGDDEMTDPDELPRLRSFLALPTEKRRPRSTSLQSRQQRTLKKRPRAVSDSAGEGSVILGSTLFRSFIDRSLGWARAASSNDDYSEPEGSRLPSLE